MRARSCSSGERGIALVSVLIGVMLLSLIAASMLSSTRTSYRLTDNALARARADALAEAAINRAVLALTDARADHRWRIDGASYRLELDGVSMTIRIQDELGKIDLNSADETLLTRLFSSVGLAPDAASALVDKILDWRSPGNTKHLNGADEADYRAAGYRYHPRRGQFQSIDELKLVMGMTPALFGKVEPALTVYSRRPTADARTAPPEVLLALASGGQATAAAILAARGDSAAGTDGAGPTLGADVSPGGRAFTISVEVREGNDHVAREAVVRLTEDPLRPYQVLAWMYAQAAR